MKIGILSDTHGTIPRKFLNEMKSCDYLIHAGDIGTEKCCNILKSLEIPIYMIRGNCDLGQWASYLPETLSFHIDGISFYLLHNLSNLSYLYEEPDIIIFGHTHQPASYESRGRLYLNPGSAGRGRTAGNSMAILTIENQKPACRFLTA
ncbi:MAG: metallophosphoesterase family protein [Hespellia sp.]|nr:metallophosphoesterase family protein [Hespellia sp.]